MQQWEYLTLVLEADKQGSASMEYTIEAEELASYSPQLLMTELNRLGAKGWELVHMQPVLVGKNEDVMMHEGGGVRRWTNKYFCAFKRPA